MPFAYVFMMRFTLKNHDFIIRDLLPEDVDEYLKFFNSLSEKSIRCRFGHLLAKLTQDAAVQRATTDADERALAIFDGQQSSIAAIGRCYFDPQAHTAEIAMVVAESHRRMGLGRFILDRLIRVASDKDSRSVHAFIATENAPVKHLLRSAGFIAQSGTDSSDVEFVLHSIAKYKTEQCVAGRD